MRDTCLDSDCASLVNRRTRGSLLLSCCCLSCYFSCKVLFLLFDSFAYFETNYVYEGQILVYCSQVLSNSLLAVFCSNVSLIQKADVL